MASYHLSVRRIKRSAGRSATAAAAYRSASVIACDREGRMHDYTAKRGVEACFILAPADAPQWAEDRAALWNAADAREEAMEALAPFSPRLIGSVATGHVRSGSDVDLHVFAWDAADIVGHVRALGWTHETEHVSIQTHGKLMNFSHVHVVDVFPLELTVYPPNELRNRPRSSTDGKPIVRIRDTMLRKLCEAEHPELYRRYVESGEVPSLDEILARGEGRRWRPPARPRLGR